MGSRGPKPVDRKALEFWYSAWLGVLDGMRRGRFIRKDFRFEAEEHLWADLMRAETADQVTAVCDKSSFWLNPKRGAIEFYRLLTERAEDFLAAKRDPRWPRSDRPTNAGRRNRFLARALAGITTGLSIRTAQDLLAGADKRSREAIYHPVCECGHREKDHTDRRNCRYCSCTVYRYSGGRELSTS